MSIREVVYYQIACDEPGCGVNTETLRGDYYAWSDQHGAVDEWVNSDGLILNDGRAFCEDHTRHHVCDLCDWTGDGATCPNDLDWLCPSCLEKAQP